MTLQGVTLSSVTVNNQIVFGDGSKQTTAFLGAAFYDRGDPGAADFLSFTNDSLWHTLDLSSIVPSGATAVSLKVSYAATRNGGGSYIELRKNGNSNTINVGIIFTQVANNVISGDMVIAVDSNRKIQYLALSGDSIDSAEVTVKGWWK